MNARVQIPRRTLADLPGLRERMLKPYHTQYFAFYSSILDGITTDPLLMTIPVDDHLVHRGDGVFETAKCVEGGIYNLQAHLDRLALSARKIGLVQRWSSEELRDLVMETVRASGKRNTLIRILLARGPGSMGISPYECPESQLYILVHALRPPFMDQHPDGARVIASAVPVKAGWFPTIKTCNYLPNAMMKKEAVDAGADFSLAFDERGHLAEGATENAGIVTQDGHLRVPAYDRMLAGTTLRRALELAPAAREQGILDVEVGGITMADIDAARELLIFGTTTDVTAACWWNGRPVGDSRPGPVFRALNQLIVHDILHNPTMRTEI